MPTGEIPTGAAGATGAVMESDYNANTILAATADNTPAALTVGASTIVGRKSTGDIVALTGAEAGVVLGLGTAATTAATAYATAAQGSTADTAVQPARSISTTAPLTGGGDLSANRTLAVSAASDTAAGVVELATTAETVTGTDTARAVTPAGAAAAYQPLDADLTDIAGIADAQGDIIVRGASGWERLAKSATSTDVLTAGASQPAWAAASGGSGGLPVQPLTNLTSGGYRLSGVPGVSMSNAGGNSALYGPRAYMTPLIAVATTTIATAELRVTTASTASKTARIAIYNADSNWQPGDLVSDLGTVATDSTGRKTITGLSVALPAGYYLVRMHLQDTTTIEAHYGESPWWSNHPLAQNHPAVYGIVTTLAYAAAETPGTALDSFAYNSSGVYSFVTFTWS